MESIFGYVSVLPGAFSAYRYEALQGAPLDKYFYLESDENRLVVEPFSANMYLAEDRIMGFEMLVKKDRNYTLHYGTDRSGRDNNVHSEHSCCYYRYSIQSKYSHSPKASLAKRIILCRSLCNQGMEPTVYRIWP